MKKLLALVLFLCMICVAAGKVSTQVFLPDGTLLPPVDSNFPHVYRDIMVGTRLMIIIDSNVAEEWVGDLFIAGEDRNRGLLSGASSLPAAGDIAFVDPWEDDLFQGFSFGTDDPPAVGDWFIADYNATDIGDCNVGLYEWFAFEPTYELSFSHVRTRDFDKDTKVDFADFAVLASYWQAADCNDPNWCEGTDLDTDRNVDFNDVMLFTDYWLERTE